MLPVSFPLTPNDVEQDFEDNLRKPLNHLLRQHQMSCKISTIQSHRPPAEEHHYVLIYARWSPGCQDTWIKIADLVLLKLKQLGRKSLKVLLTDRRGLVSPFTDPIAPDDSLLPDWPTMAHKILDAVAPNTTWLSLDLLWRWKEWPKYDIWRGSWKEENYESEPKKVKVVLVIQWESQEAWNSAISRVEAVIANNPIYKSRGVELELVRGGLFGLTLIRKPSFQPAPVTHLEEWWNEVPYMGASIGPESGIGSGSYGCTITLDDRPYGITACHVVLPTSDDRYTYADPEAQRHIDPRHIPLLETGATLGDIPGQLPVRMPSKQDLEDTERYYRDKIAEGKELLAGKLEFVQSIVEAGIEDQCSRRNLAELKECKEELRKYEELKAKASEGLTQTGGFSALGEATAFSGFRKDDESGMILDWALIPLSDSKAPKENKMPKSLGTKGFPSPPRSRKLTEFVDPRLYEHVYKRGRSSGLTDGYINSAKSVLHGLYTRVWPKEYDDEKKKVTLSRPWAVGIVPSLWLQPTAQFVFGMPGDSGAAIFNEKGEVKGILVAGCQGDTKMVYMMPVSEMIKDIKAKTGATKVGLPQGKRQD
ncbi:hypothetical protein A1O3_03272 [Capronia epimyces CBS 606.96]|uniref:Peptidase S1 domain-containing protein n=1 Tax=Capronia epimyces CBS 606.96 TaxID=1182542 RepID=W9YAM9_9EURO|nr:uncharacterized protein A1O3_03272 [Capronia epimyces CBS 606.96]EXJ86321.1 hypothetical protein A1O3_03272 [Capronia epimyces CBS 606.96]